MNHDIQEREQEELLITGAALLEVGLWGGCLCERELYKEYPKTSSGEPVYIVTTVKWCPIHNVGTDLED